MVRHMVRQVVKHGHYKDFLAASKAWNDAAVKVGLPAYRLYQSNWGTFNEVFSEAEYEDSGDIERRIDAANAPNNTELNEAFPEPGQSSRRRRGSRLRPAGSDPDVDLPMA